jgi:hypothetical protein
VGIYLRAAVSRPLLPRLWVARSQLKAKIEERFAPSLAKRVSIHLASYREQLVLRLRRQACARLPMGRFDDARVRESSVDSGPPYQHLSDDELRTLTQDLRRARCSSC